jgi:WD40 repeat protein/serine/threonine protein kinase
MPGPNSHDFDLIDRLADEFAARYRRGERPSVEEYADRFPHLAAELRELLPAMVDIEQAKDEMADEASTAPVPALTQLGDFHILREIGHGGMGVVYEAEQVSLGRRVALKVLTQKTVRDAQQLARFEREAKAAAKLHHTNIVPVYGVGEHEGTPYYVMQFIQGLGLDEVILELSRMASGTPSPATPPKPTRRSLSARRAARSLMTGQFRAASNGTENHAAMPPTIDRPASHKPAREEPAEAPASGSGDDVADRRPDAPGLTSSVRLPGQSESATGRKSRRLTYWQSVARVGVQVADALEYAHKQGVVHRDVKPSNLLLDLEGTVWVADFGLAKADDSENLTHTGDLLGTLRYMPPEAFEGKADARGDVYGLGLTLYELLALRPAFAEPDRHRLIKQVTEAEPIPLRKVRPAVPTDLETVVHKAIDRDPGRRYRTAAELAADLRRFLDDQPIRARKVSEVERAWRWCRRNPYLASALSAVAMLLLALAVGASVAAVYLGRAAHTANVARRAAETTLTDMYTSSGLVAGARDDPRQAVLWFAHAARLAADDLERAEINRIRAAAWGRKAIRPVRAVVHPADWIENNLAFHPGGRHLLTHGFHPATEETDCRLWDLEREVALPFPGNPGVVSAAAWDAAGERLAVGTPQGDVTISRFPNSEPLQRLSFAGRIARVLFSPGGRYCAVAAANRVRVWDCRQAAFATPELEHPEPVATLAFDSQSELLATGCRDGNCRVFTVPVETNTPLFTPVPHHPSLWERRFGTTPLPPLFLDEGRGLLTAYLGEASWRDPRTGKVLRTRPFGEPTDKSGMNAVALSGDGKHLAVGGSFGDRHLRIYDVATGLPVSPYLEHRAQQPVLSVAFSPDGQTLLTCSGDHTARLWSGREGKLLGNPLTHPTTVSAVAFAPDGRHLATAQRGGLIRLWALPAGNPRDYHVPVGAQSFVRLSRDGRLLLPAGGSHRGCALRSTQVLDVTTGQRVGPPLKANGFVLDAAFSPDGLQVAAAVSLAASSEERSAQPGQQPGQLLLWDWQAGKLQHEPLQMPSEPRQLDYSSDGLQLAVICAKGELVVIDPATGKKLQRWQAHPPHLDNIYPTNNGNGAVRFSPDNRSLLTFGSDTNSVRVWDALTGQRRCELTHNKGKCRDVQFSPDGRLVATAGMDNQVYVWELATGAKLASLAHPDWVFTAVFSPDGKQLLTGCRDYMARLWDWRADEQDPRHTFEHEQEVHAVAFTPDGRHVLSAGNDEVLRIWELSTAKPVCPPLAFRGFCKSLAVTPDGRRVVCGGLLKEMQVFHLDDCLASPALEPDDLCLWGEVLSGQRVENGGGVTNLTADEWLQRWRDFRARRPDFDGPHGR